jgi:two-component system nitrogen regulation sensor histidine kinase GlnL
LNNLFQHTLESINIGILVFDRAGKLVYLNPAAEEILQGSSQALKGKHYRTLFRGSLSAARIARKALTENAAVTGFDVELRLPHRGGATLPPLSVIIGASPLYGPGREQGGAVLSIKPAEILTMVEQDAQAAFSAEEMQMLAYGIAHEIKNPLGGILGAGQWILRGGASEEERSEGIRLILREAERINGLVEKMLEMGKSPPSPRPFPLLPVLRQAEDLLRAEIRAQGKEIVFEQLVDPSLPDVSGHPDTIFQAIVNILKNAVEAIERKGTIRIDARMNFNYRWSRGRGRKRSFLELTIADNGPGMSEENVRKALLPFYTTKPRGTGLGLVMARQAVTRHGGKLEIKSVRGTGTAVKISLPVDPGKKPPS